MKFKHTPLIHTERLCLRAICEQDLEDGLALITNPQISKTYMLPDFRSREEAVALFQRLKNRSASDACFMYAICLDGRMIGYIHDVEIRENTVEVGYLIDPGHSRRGYATEALNAAISEFFDAGFSAVKAGAFEGNVASMRVMEKCGMTRTGEEEQIEYRGKMLRCIYYQLDRPADRPF